MEHDLEILAREEGNLVARYRNLMIQVRRGLMTESMLRRIESSARLLRSATPGAVGAVSLVEEGAGLAEPALRARQVAVVRELLSHPRTHLAAVVLGESVGTRAVRSVMRLALLGVPRLHTAATPEEAAEWMAARLGNLSRDEILTAIERARAAARG